MINPPQGSISLRTRIWNITKILIAVVLIGFVISTTDIQQLELTWKSLSQDWLLASVLLFFLMIIVKTLQYRALINPNLSFWNVLNITVLQNAISNFVSNAAGVATYAAMFKEDHGVKLSRSALAFVLIKVGDLFAILVILVSSLLFVWPSVEPLHGLLLILSIGIFAVLAVFICTLVFRQWFVEVLRKFLEWIRLIRIVVVQRLLSTLEAICLLDHAHVIRLLVKVLIYSSLYFFVTVSWAITVVYAFNIDIELPGILFISGMQQIISFIPIQVFGGIGVTEVSSMVLYGFFGIPQSEISAALLGIRIYNTLLNGLSLLYIPFGKNKS